MGGSEKRFFTAAESETLGGEGEISEADIFQSCKKPRHHFLRKPTITIHNILLRASGITLGYFGCAVGQRLALKAP